MSSSERKSGHDIYDYKYGPKYSWLDIQNLRGAFMD